MKCRKCGAELLDTDTFCVNCGQKVEKNTYCPNCGEKLREGEKFCHKCGIMISAEPEDEDIPLVQQKTVDIPLDEIEQGILLQAEQAIVKRPAPERLRRTAEDYKQPGQEIPERTLEGYKQPGIRETESYYEKPDYNKKQTIGTGKADSYRRTAESERRRPAGNHPVYHDEEFDDYDDGEDNDESKMKIITIVLGIAIIAVVLVVAYILWSRNSSFRYERPGNDTRQEESGDEESEKDAGNNAETQGRLQILSNVNVRNKPDKDNSEVLMVAKKGETYEYYELVNDSWYHIQLEDGGEGYVYKDYVEDLE